MQIFKNDKTEVDYFPNTGEFKPSDDRDFDDTEIYITQQDTDYSSGKAQEVEVVIALNSEDFREIVKNLIKQGFGL